jgi:hypothetical protein
LDPNKRPLPAGVAPVDGTATVVVGTIVAGTIVAGTIVAGTLVVGTVDVGTVLVGTVVVGHTTKPVPCSAHKTSASAGR